MKKRYHSEIEEKSSLYGNKASNLMYLEKILQKQENKNAQIPEFIALSEQDILSSLEDKVSNWKENWNDKWTEFVEAQKQNPDKLSENAKEKLTAIRNLITSAFRENDNLFSSIAFPDSIKNSLFMVRSSSEEDKVGSGNQGANDSFACHAENINYYILEVLSSYFSEKSMMSRLISGEDITAHPPKMSCLVQKMVGVDLENTDQSSSSRFFSGVVYTDDGRVRIDSAPGHNNLIVNGEGVFDQYYVTRDNMVFLDKGNKKVKISPIFNEETKKVTLSKVENDFLGRISRLSTETVLAISELARYIADEYEMNIDLEFIYDNDEQKINIVQVRQRSSASKTISALSNKFIAEKSPLYAKGNVVTIDLMNAIKIDNPEQILILKNIETAQEAYHDLTNKGINIKAIIIQDSAPSTSHPAGFFTQLEVPVLQIANISAVEKLRTSLCENNILIADPQHASLFLVQQNDIDEYLLSTNSQDIIEDGLIKSTITSSVTPVRIKRIESDTLKKMYDIIQPPNDSYIKIGNLKILSEYLENVSIPKNDDNQRLEQIKSLKIILNFVYAKAKYFSNKQHPLVQELIIVGTKLYEALQDVSLFSDNSKFRDYLDIYNKFYGLIMEQPGKDSLSKSLFYNMSLIKEEDKYRDYGKKENLEGLNLENFISVAKLEKFIIDNALKQKWLEFCVEYCKTQEKFEALNLMSRSIVSADMHEYWLNTEFPLLDKNIPSNELKNRFESLSESLLSLKKAAIKIDELEHQVSEWGKEEKFDSLYSQFKEKIKMINTYINQGKDSNDLLTKHAAFEQLNRLIDVFDRSIKSVQISSLYQDKEKQAMNFRDLVNDFYELMKKHLVRNLQEGQFVVNIKSFNIIDTKYKTELRFLNKESLVTSPLFSVDATSFYGISTREFNSGVSNMKSLADFHSFVHQNFLSSLALNSMVTNKKLLELPLPDSFKIIHESLLTSISYKVEGIQCFISPASIISLDLRNSILISEYNIPINLHSGKLYIEYDIKSNTMRLNYNVWGPNHYGRWQGLLEASPYILNQAGFKVSYVTTKESQISMEMQASSQALKNNPNIIDAIKEITKYTMIPLPKHIKEFLLFLKLRSDLDYNDIMLNVINSLNRNKLINTLDLTDELKEELKKSDADALLILYYVKNIESEDIQKILQDVQLQGNRHSKSNLYLALTNKVIINKLNLSPERSNALLQLKDKLLSNIINYYFKGYLSIDNLEHTKLDILKMLLKDEINFENRYHIKIKKDDFINLINILQDASKKQSLEIDKLISFLYKQNVGKSYDYGVKISSLAEIYIEYGDDVIRKSFYSLDQALYNKYITAERFTHLLKNQCENPDYKIDTDFVGHYADNEYSESLKESTTQLYDLPSDEEGVEAYKAGASPSELVYLKENNPELYTSLTSKEAIEAYKAGASFSELMDLYNDNRNSFESIIKLQIFSSFSKNNIKIFFSDIRQLYEEGYEQELQLLTIDVFKSANFKYSIIDIVKILRESDLSTISEILYYEKQNTALIFNLQDMVTLKNKDINCFEAVFKFIKQSCIDSSSFNEKIKFSFNEITQMYYTIDDPNSYYTRNFLHILKNYTSLLYILKEKIGTIKTAEFFARNHDNNSLMDIFRHFNSQDISEALVNTIEKIYKSGEKNLNALGSFLYYLEKSGDFQQEYEKLKNLILEGELVNFADRNLDSIEIEKVAAAAVNDYYSEKLSSSKEEEKPVNNQPIIMTALLGDRYSSELPKTLAAVVKGAQESNKKYELTDLLKKSLQNYNKNTSEHYSPKITFFGKTTYQKMFDLLQKMVEENEKTRSGRSY